MLKYEIKKTEPTVYLDEVGNAITGFKITVYLPRFDETQFLTVPNLKAETVKAAADDLYNNRVALSDLSDEV